MLAIEYVRSVPRFLTARFVGPRWNWIYTSSLGTIRLTDVAQPPLPSPQWARVKPILSGICGSDLATLTAKGSTYFSPFTSCPFIFGHEVVGRVVEIGPAVRRVKVGDKVVLEPPLHCRVRGIEPVCRECAVGKTSHCTNVAGGDIAEGVQTGYCRDTGGGWSSGFVAHQLQLHVIDGDLPDQAAVLIEPFSCSLQAAQIAAPEADQTVLVIGCGTIGALTIAALRALGTASRIIAVAKYPNQRKAALAFGADQVIDSGAGSFEKLAQTLGSTIHHPDLSRPVLLGGGADVCLDCIGSSGSIDDALRLTRNRGTVILVGMPGVPAGVDWTSIWYKELNVRGSYTSDSATFKKSIEIVAQLKQSLDGFVGAQFGLQEYREAIRVAMRSGREGVLKTVFAPL